jgi:hypothetical protein
LPKAASQKPIESISETRQNENCQRQTEALIEKKRDKNRNEHHPEDGEHVGNGKNPGGHQWLKANC